MTATPMTVTDEQVATLVDRYGYDGVVELNYQIALENQRSRFNHALGITDQGFSSGDSCRVPWDVERARHGSSLTPANLSGLATSYVASDQAVLDREPGDARRRAGAGDRRPPSRRSRSRAGR